MNSGNYDVAIDFSNLFMDDSSLALQSICRSTARRTTARARRTRDSTSSTTHHMRERDPEKRKALIQAFEKRAVRAGLSAAAAVVVPHRADPQDRDGLADVAKPQSRRRARRGLAEHLSITPRDPARACRARRPECTTCSATPSTASC